MLAGIPHVPLSRSGAVVGLLQPRVHCGAGKHHGELQNDISIPFAQDSFEVNTNGNWKRIGVGIAQDK